jgi:hypothetical protein
MRAYNALGFIGGARGEQHHCAPFGRDIGQGGGLVGNDVVYA